ncbi:unnamed protein product [Tetraodon nigroviridis]|nr:unnamed protein product [Tetraodon nigroviridis]
MAETQDASTQCSFVGDSPSVGRGTDLCHSPVDASAPNPARRGQCCTALQQDTNAPSMGEAGSSIKSLWRQQKPRHNCVTSTNVRTKSPQNQSDYKSILQRPINPFLNTLSDNKDARMRENQGSLMKSFCDDVREEVASINRASEEGETTQEVAKILLLLQQMRD